jgi:hypothetical protein
VISWFRSLRFFKCNLYRYAGVLKHGCADWDAVASDPELPFAARARDDAPDAAPDAVMAEAGKEEEEEEERAGTAAGAGTAGTAAGAGAGAGVDAVEEGGGGGGAAPDSATKPKGKGRGRPRKDGTPSVGLYKLHPVVTHSLPPPGFYNPLIL